MRKLTTLPLLILISFSLNGCAGMTGALNWKENTLQSNQDRNTTFLAASQALSRVGDVSFSDSSIGSVNGDCGKKTSASITISEKEEIVIVLIKAKWNVNSSTMAIDTGEKQGCINRIIAEMKVLGCDLTAIPIAP